MGSVRVYKYTYPRISHENRMTSFGLICISLQATLIVGYSANPLFGLIVVDLLSNRWVWKRAVEELILKTNDKWVYPISIRDWGCSVIAMSLDILYDSRCPRRQDDRLDSRFKTQRRWRMGDGRVCFCWLFPSNLSLVCFLIFWSLARSPFESHIYQANVSERLSGKACHLLCMIATSFSSPLMVRMLRPWSAWISFPGSETSEPSSSTNLCHATPV